MDKILVVSHGGFIMELFNCSKVLIKLISEVITLNLFIKMMFPIVQLIEYKSNAKIIYFVMIHVLTNNVFKSNSYLGMI